MCCHVTQNIYWKLEARNNAVFALNIAVRDGIRVYYVS